MSSIVPPSNGEGGQPASQGPSLPKQIPTGLDKAYPADKVPTIKKWFEQMFPGLSGSDLDTAVSEFTRTEEQFMSVFMKQLDKQQKEADDRMRRSIRGEE